MAFKDFFEDAPHLMKFSSGVYFEFIFTLEQIHLDPSLFHLGVRKMLGSNFIKFVKVTQLYVENQKMPCDDFLLNTDKMTPCIKVGNVFQHSYLNYTYFSSNPAMIPLKTLLYT